MSSSSQTQAAIKLRALAQEEFGALSEAESRMLYSAATDEEALCGKSKNKNDASNAPRFSETGIAGSFPPWGKDRDIRSDMIRWVCTSETAKKLLDPSGIQVFGARIMHHLDLTALHLPVPLALRHCRLLQPAVFQACQLESLDLEGSWTRDIDFSFATIARSLLLYRDFRAEGQLDLRRTRIAQDLRIESAFVGNPSGYAILADGISVGGYAFLRAGGPRRPPSTFQAEGVVSLLNATVGADLDFGGAYLSNPRRTSLILDQAVIGGELRLTSQSGYPFRADGSVSLQLCRCQSFEDDPNHWPQPGPLILDGFTYGGVSGDGWDPDTRLRWLQLDPSGDTQPYRQLAKIFRESGQEEPATQVLIEMERKLVSKEPAIRRYPTRVLGTIGYGYRPGRAAWGLAGVAGLGALLYWRSYRMGKMVPTDKDAASDAILPDYYPRFQPLMYSLENTFPLVKLGQADKWQPSPKSRLRWIVWLQILLGWLLATLFVAGIAGLVQHS